MIENKHRLIIQSAAIAIINSLYFIRTKETLTIGFSGLIINKIRETLAKHLSVIKNEVVILAAIGSIVPAMIFKIILKMGKDNKPKIQLMMLGSALGIIIEGVYMAKYINTQKFSSREEKKETALTALTVGLLVGSLLIGVATLTGEIKTIELHKLLQPLVILTIAKLYHRQIFCSMGSSLERCQRKLVEAESFEHLLRAQPTDTMCNQQGNLPQANILASALGTEINSNN